MRKEKIASDIENVDMIDVNITEETAQELNFNETSISLIEKDNLELNVRDILSIVQNELKVPKLHFNAFGKYHYRNCEDIFTALKPLMLVYGFSFVIDDEIVEIGNRIYVKATAIFTYKKEEVRTNGYAREEENKKGMDSMQLTGATSTYARKYAQNAMFLIDDTRDSDATNNHDKEEQVKQTPAPAPLVVLNESNIDYAIKNNKQDHLLSLINVKYSATNEQILRLKEVF
jgi:hypothetical protein